MTAHTGRRTMTLRSPNAGAATPQQDAIAALVLDRIRHVRPDLKNVSIDSAQMVAAVAPTTLRPADVQMGERLQKALDAMSDADLGRTVRQSGRLFTRYVQESPNPSARLLEIGVRALQAGIVGLMRGGANAAVRGFGEEHNRLDRQLLVAVNTKIVATRADAEQFVEAQRADLVTEIARERAVLAEEHQRLHDEREMALSAVSGAQAEATALRRELDAQRAANGQKLATADAEALRLTRLLESERSANTNRERDARNTLHQARQDLNSSRTVIAHLNAECERLESQSAAPIPLEVSPMPTTVHRYAFATALEATSFTVYARVQGADAAVLGCLMTSAGGLDACHFHAWKAAYPTPTSMLAQLRAVVRLILGRVA